LLAFTIKPYGDSNAARSDRTTHGRQALRSARKKGQVYESAGCDAARNLAQLALLVGRGLIEGGYAEIKDYSSHGLALPVGKLNRHPKMARFAGFRRRNFEEFIRTPCRQAHCCA
jgi:hypothetical protein